MNEQKFIGAILLIASITVAIGFLSVEAANGS
jgi:hypothetical protein